MGNSLSGEEMRVSRDRAASRKENRQGKPPHQAKTASGQRRDSLSQQITRRVILLSLTALLGLLTAMSLGLTTSVERVKRKLDRAGAQAARNVDLALLDIKSDLVATSASLGVSNNRGQIIQTMLQRNPEFFAIWLTTPDGTILEQHHQGATVHPFTRHENLETYSHKAVQLSPIQFADNSPYIDLSTPVQNAAWDSLGTLTVRVDLMALWTLTGHIRPSEAGYVYLTDDEGQIIAIAERRSQQPNIYLKDVVGRSPLEMSRSGFNGYRGVIGRIVVASVQRLEVVPWFVVVEQPAGEFATALLLVTVLWLFVLLAVLALVFNILAFTQRRIVFSLSMLQETVRRLSQGEWDSPLAIANRDELGELAQLLQQMSHQLQESFVQLEASNTQMRQLNAAYERFVPNQFLRFLEKDSIIEVELGDAVEKEMSVLFADIRNFTTFSEQMTPADNFKFLNAYLSRMEPAITQNGGFIDKYIGDEIMALFSGSADDAVQAGVSMLKRLASYNQHRHKRERTPISIGIGINTGHLMLGTVGGNRHMDGTVVSDTVNLASRLERLTRLYRVSLLISHQTFLKLSHRSEYGIRLIDRVIVKGKSEQVSVFEVFDADPPDVYEGKQKTKTRFEQALLCYYMGDLPQAVQLLAECLSVNPQDSVAQIYLERCYDEQAFN
ncbi:adenylate/guanylate cyclase domain-containing protein [Spirulina subsalsa]|uniref:adenylate/guanylate cyclase domain-containing protein n=1 Tax=Spirulina subsalsa TaxID=54311 RepID=UPI0002F7D0CB|nr:adenylate/guanylate cyclase domain-containing protein [Spirulina subsalsa]